ncbi:MAG: phospho-N-acetylmuramoyl-pentapeptide-transferase [Prevotella sp.]|nr:phospho-N-acetylmuramoyl-pentapeptide-transferase [Prevotella sp.]
MLYYLFRFLDQFGVIGSHLWSYISFRALLALILSLVISAWFGEHFIKYLHRKNINETQRDPEIDPFGLQKIGVPSMGGVIIIVSILVPVLLIGRLRNVYLILMIVTTLWLGVLGFLDDYIKIFKKNKDGLSGKFKILGQVGLGLIIGLTLYLSPDVVIRENVEMKEKTEVVIPMEQNVEVLHKAELSKSTKTTIPFVKNHNLDYTDIFSFLGKYKDIAGWIFIIIITILVVTAVSNGANLNDGMDGMCAGNSAIIGIALGILAYVSSHIEYATYLNIMYIPGTQELVVFMCAFVGALVGFLWYNAYPAQIFMGDTGSLTIGGLIGVCAICIHKELLLPLLCGIFFIESLSVILQVEWFKLGKRRGVKQRIFKRTPIHDHFRTQLSQLDPECKYIFKKSKNVFHESKIVVRFWIATIIMAALTIITLKIR